MLEDKSVNPLKFISNELVELICTKHRLSVNQAENRQHYLISNPTLAAKDLSKLYKVVWYLRNFNEEKYSLVVSDDWQREADDLIIKGKYDCALVSVNNGETALYAVVLKKDDKYEILSFIESNHCRIALSI